MIAGRINMIPTKTDRDIFYDEFMDYFGEVCTEITRELIISNNIISNISNIITPMNDSFKDNELITSAYITANSDNTNIFSYPSLVFQDYLK